MASQIENYMQIYINYRTVITKLYSKFMEDSENIIKMPYNTPIANQNSKTPFQISKQSQQPHQNICAFSAYQTFGIVQNGIKQLSNNGCSYQQWQQQLFGVKFLLFGISSLQFSILFGLLIVLLISSIFSIYQFSLAIFFNLLIHIALWVTIWFGTKVNQTFQKKEQQEIFFKNKDAMNLNKRTANATVLKISPFYHQRGEVKTKKIQAVELQSKIDYVPQSTLKKVQIAPIVKQNSNKNQAESISIVPKLCAVIKIAQTLVTLSLSIVSIMMSTSQHQDFNKTILILSLLVISTQIISAISFGVCLSKMPSQKKAQIINQNELNRLSKQNEYQIQYVQNHTVTSIDNALQLKKEDVAGKNGKKEGKEVKMMGMKVEEQGKQVQGQINQTPKSINSHTPKSINSHTPKSICEAEKSQKNQFKKSVLKSSKSNMVKSTKTPVSLQEEVDYIISKRKVEINEKKIQYFEYSASGSITNSNDQHPPRAKSKYSEQKIQILQKKLEIEAQILKKKMQERKVVSASARNHKTISNKKDVSFNQNVYFC